MELKRKQPVNPIIIETLSQWSIHFAMLFCSSFIQTDLSRHYLIRWLAWWKWNISQYAKSISFYFWLPKRASRDAVVKKWIWNMKHEKHKTLNKLNNGLMRHFVFWIWWMNVCNNRRKQSVFLQKPTKFCGIIQNNMQTGPFFHAYNESPQNVQNDIQIRMWADEDNVHSLQFAENGSAWMVLVQHNIMISMLVSVTKRMSESNQHLKHALWLQLFISFVLFVSIRGSSHVLSASNTFCFIHEYTENIAN